MRLVTRNGVIIKHGDVVWSANGKRSGVYLYANGERIVIKWDDEFHTSPDGYYPCAINAAWSEWSDIK